MNDIEQFRSELSGALHHLHDPDYQPGDRLCTVLDLAQVKSCAAVQVALADMIRAWLPSPDAPTHGRIQQEYDVLRYRFLSRLTQEATAEILNLSVRSVQRLQREAIHGLAIMLWERQHTTHTPEHIEGMPAWQKSTAGAPSDWHTQAEAELASLVRSDPNSTADVAETLDSLLELGNALTSNPTVHLEVAHLQPGLIALVHPSVLRQMLITAIGRLAKQVSSGPITAYAVLEDASVKITLTVAVSANPDHPLSASEFTQDILAPSSSSVEACVEYGRVFLYLRMPSTGEITVLAVDDNLDMLHFYRRCTAGTPYRVEHVTSGREAQEFIKTRSPDIVVLDVMLPDVDGWKPAADRRHKQIGSQRLIQWILS